MSLKLIPNVEVELPLNTYYGVTLLSLSVGNSDITSCTVKLGDKDFEFKTSAHSDDGLLYVDGDRDKTPTYKLLSPKLNVKLLLPDTVAVKVGSENIMLNHYLSYSVPHDKQQ